MTRKETDRLAVLEVMVEMLTAADMARWNDPDQALDDYRDVAGMMLSHRHPTADLDGVLAERMARVREHLAAYRRAAAN